MNVTDVMSKIKVVEQSLGAFIKQNNEQFKAITEVICKSSSSGTTSDVVLLETPSKRRKVSQAPGSVEGVTPLGQNHGVSFRDMAKRTINRSRASHQQQQFPSLPVQGLQFTNQSHLQPTNNTVSNTNNRNKRRNSALVFGNGTTASNNDHVLSADVNLVASGVSKQATQKNF